MLILLWKLWRICCFLIGLLLESRLLLGCFCLKAFVWSRFLVLMGEILCDCGNFLCFYSCLEVVLNIAFLFLFPILLVFLGLRKLSFLFYTTFWGIIFRGWKNYCYSSNCVCD